VPPVQTSVEALLKELNQTIPVERGIKPIVTESIQTSVVPVYSFRPSPLADQLLRIETFALAFTLTAANDNIQWSSVPVPTLEVHRYFHIWVSHNHGSNRRFTLNVLQQRGTAGFIFASGREVEKDVPTGIRTNMLSPNGDLNRDSLNFGGTPLDMYPGMSFNVANLELLALLSVNTFQGIRLVMRGPEAVGGQDVTADYFANES